MTDDRARRRAEQPTERRATLPAPLAALWRTTEPSPRRGPRPGLTLDGITDAAVALADAEGLRAVSMARVAEALGVSTMALYRYVSGKDELVGLMYDAALADVGRADAGEDARVLAPAPGDAPAWRARLLDWFDAQLGLVARHPWLMRAAWAVPVPGPSQVAVLEAGLAALADTPLSLRQRVDVVGAASLLVLSEGQLLAAALAGGPGPATGGGGGAEDPDGAAHPGLVDFAGLLGLVVRPESQPHVAAALAAGAFDDDGPDAPGDGGLAFRVGVFLDGVAALVARAER